MARAGPAGLSHISPPRRPLNASLPQAPAPGLPRPCGSLSMPATVPQGLATRPGSWSHSNSKCQDNWACPAHQPLANPVSSSCLLDRILGNRELTVTFTEGLENGGLGPGLGLLQSLLCPRELPTFQRAENDRQGGLAHRRAYKNWQGGLEGLCRRQEMLSSGPRGPPELGRQAPHAPTWALPLGAWNGSPRRGCPRDQPPTHTLGTDLCRSLMFPCATSAPPGEPTVS